MYHCLNTVPPAPPSSLSATTLNSTHTRISWTLTHQTDDESATSLLLNVVSPLPSSLQVPPSHEAVVIETLPGTTYTVTLTATNQDGQATTPNMSFTTNPLGKCSVVSRKWYYKLAITL